MKNTFKRIAAFALILCMLLSVVPAVAFAEGAEPAQLDHKEYDFNLKAYTYSWKSGDNVYTDIPLSGDGKGTVPTDAAANFADGTLKGNAAQEAVAALYEAGTVDWKYHSVGNITSDTKSFAFSFGKTSVNYNLTLTASNQAGAYFAMTIKSPGTGDYKLTLDYFTHTSGANQGSVYVLPASVTDIVGALDYYDSLGTFKCESKVTSGTVLGTGTTTFSNTVSMKAGKEYILVFTNDALSESHTGNGTRATLYLDKVTLDKQEKTPVLDLDTITYNFDLGDLGLTYGADVNFYDKSLSQAGSTGDSRRAAVTEAYNNGTIYWNYHSATTANPNFKTAGNKAAYAMYLYDTNWSTEGYYAAIIRSPGNGNYILNLDYYTHNTGAAEGSAYLLPANTENIAAALTDETKLGSFCCESTSTSFEKETIETVVSMEAGEEYLLVYKCEKKDDTQTDGKAYLYLGNVTMNRIVSMDEIEYDFDRRSESYSYTSGGNTSNTTLAGKNVASKTGNSNVAGRNHLAAIYKTTEEYNWNYHSVGNTATGTAAGYNFSFAAADANYSMYLASSNLPGSYFATTVVSPGYGDYTLTLNYNTHKTGASEARIYILPVDTADIAAAIAAGTAVATFSCDDPTITDNKVLGEKTATFDVSLGMDEEYLMVFTNDAIASEKTNGGDRATIYLSGVKLTNKAAGGAEEVLNFNADGKDFATFEEAVAVAYDADDLAVKLNADVAMDELIVPANLSIDLNGKTLTVDALSGSVTDSSAGNTGLLAAERDTIVFSAKNADAPLWDAAAGGYRFFDYLLEVFDEAEAVEGKPSSQKFWFKFHFYTDDACTELDQDAYALVAGGNSGFKVATHMSWNGEALPSVYYGIDGDVDAFSRGWATNATASRWLYIRVDGLDEDLNGTLRVKPELEANGVYISNTVVSYVNEAPDTAE